MTCFTYDAGLNPGSYWGFSGGTTTGNVANGTGYQRQVTSSNVRMMSTNTTAGYAQQMQIVDRYIQAGEIDKALEKYNELFDNIKTSNSYGNYQIDDYQVATIMANSYAGATGNDIISALDKKTTSPFISGIMQGIPVIGWFFAEDTTSAEAYAKLDNDKVSKMDKAKEYAGAIASGAAIGTAIGGWTFGIGTLIGGAAGAVSVFLKDLA